MVLLFGVCVSLVVVCLCPDIFVCFLFWWLSGALCACVVAWWGFGCVLFEWCLVRVGVVCPFWICAWSFHFMVWVCSVVLWLVVVVFRWLFLRELLFGLCVLPMCVSMCVCVFVSCVECVLSGHSSVVNLSTCLCHCVSVRWCHIGIICAPFLWRGWVVVEWYVLFCLSPPPWVCCGGVTLGMYLKNCFVFLGRVLGVFIFLKNGLLYMLF